MGLLCFHNSLYVKIHPLSRIFFKNFCRGYKGEIDIHDAKLEKPVIEKVVSAGGNYVKVTWGEVENARNYIVSYSTDGGVSWENDRNVITDVSLQKKGSTYSYVLSGMTYKNKTQFKVRALPETNYAESEYSEIVEKLICPMDTDGNGTIGQADLWGFRFAYNETVSTRYDDFACYDINGDGFVRASDYTLLSVNWNKSASDSTLIYPASPASLADTIFDADDDEIDFLTPDIDVELAF